MLYENKKFLNWLSQVTGLPTEEVHHVPAHYSKTERSGLWARFSRWWHGWQVEISERFPKNPDKLKEWEERGWKIIDRPPSSYTLRNPIIYEIVHGIQGEFPQANKNSQVAEAPEYGRIAKEWVGEEMSISRGPKEPDRVAHGITRTIELKPVGLRVPTGNPWGDDFYPFHIGYNGHSDTLHIRYLGR